MTRRRKILLCVLCGLIAVGAVCFFYDRDNEPIYKGRTLSQWLEPLEQSTLNHGELVVDYTAPTEAINAIGTNAIPILLKWHRTSADTYWLQTRVQKLPRIFRLGLIQQFVDHYTQKRATRQAQVQFAVTVLGSKALGALPDLEQAYRSFQKPEEIHSTAALIACLRQPGIDFLVQELNTTQIRMRRHVIANVIAEASFLGIDTSATVDALNAAMEKDKALGTTVIYQRALKHIETEEEVQRAIQLPIR